MTDTGLNRGPKLAERVAQAIVGDIASRGLTTGDRLAPEAVMTAQYGVGRASLREALRILEVHGLITMKTGPGGGPVVGAADAHSFGRTSALYFQSVQATIGELISARLVMEPVTARLSAECTDETLREALRAHLDQGKALDLEATGQYNELTASFHALVSEMSGNRVLSLISSGLRALFRDRVTGAVYPPDERGRVVREHHQIGLAILNGNGRRAETLMRQHMIDLNATTDRHYVGIENDIIDWI